MGVTADPLLRNTSDSRGLPEPSPEAYRQQREHDQERHVDPDRDRSTRPMPRRFR